MAQSAQLRKKILAAPQAPGVYLMRNLQKQVLYVGKAKALKQRLHSYLDPDLSGKTRSLMAQVADVEVRLTANEALALLLEYKLIHELKPKYNVSLKDDKSFPRVEISREKFPALQIVRQQNVTGARYLGPYTNSKLLKEVLKIIRFEFGYRSCRKLPKQSCIYDRINLCPAPCIGKISQRAYQRRLADIILILEGQGDLLIRRLTKAMQVKASAQDFEAAASIRDQITALSRMSGQPDEYSSKNELQLLAKSLGLKNIPARIEGFDISNISGTSATGSMVSFYHGQPDKNNYRRFRIKAVNGIDDYKMLAEVLFRRYNRLLQEKKALPDLLLIDGGKGHLQVAARVLAGLNLDIPLMSIAKPRNKTCGFKRAKAAEHIYSSSSGVGRLVLVKAGAALNLIRRIRDEAHRFALGYHHLLHKKEIYKKC